jgi:hypothetical protein
VPDKAKPQPARADEYVAPVLMRRAFHCMHCGVYTTRSWHALFARSQRAEGTNVRRCMCFNCDGVSFWYDARGFVLDSSEDASAPVVWPWTTSVAPMPRVDMPADAKADYEEARTIVDRSPRGAAALLRLALQKLMVDLGEPGKNINTDIGQLVAKGLDQVVQQALDTVRIVGNAAVHPGELDMKDDRETAVKLFEILNFIVDEGITKTKAVKQMYELVSPEQRGFIADRDKASERPGKA